ncbi:hypothetical protein SELMODRAFT_408047 [Selaginella moellendorffii]|uniref:Uncharacterized protein n=1 Tax=Selaginella moellendorffii TaxID=88036 RepID=D8R713_SELML|nr:hypothetical protein SELMODRAFT_408047 [Selaginella moellendorffii]
MRPEAQGHVYGKTIKSTRLYLAELDVTVVAGCSNGGFLEKNNSNRERWCNETGLQEEDAELTLRSKGRKNSTARLIMLGFPQNVKSTPLPWQQSKKLEEWKLQLTQYVFQGGEVVDDGITAWFHRDFISRDVKALMPMLLVAIRRVIRLQSLVYGLEKNTMT